jgi:hypothetical protein
MDWIEYDRFLVAGDIACGIASLTPARVSSADACYLGIEQSA